MKKISIIGIGMGSRKTLTNEAVERIEEADVLIGAERMIESCTDLGKPYYIAYKNNEISEYIHSQEYENVCLLVSGDVGFYSGTKKLLPLLEEYEVELIPGVSSLSYFCAKLKMSWEHVYPLNIHETLQNLIPAVANHEKTFVLTNGNVNEICSKLLDANLGYVEVYAGEHLSYENERIIHGIPAELIGMDFEPLSVLLFVNKQHGNCALTGIPDKEFICGNLSNTTSDIRALILSKLHLKNDGIAYDIGSGTGAVAVEMALNSPNGKVFAIELKDEAIRIIEKNKTKFYTGNLSVISGFAPEILENLPHPDSVFIGGSKGRTEDILEFLKQTTTKPVRIVFKVTAIEMLSDLLMLIKTYELSDLEMVQVSVSRGIGDDDYHVMKAQNPVFLISGNLK